MSPDISRQFRGLEDFLESQQRQERISFLGSDISPVVDVDPGTQAFELATTESILITGPVTLAILAQPPLGFFHAYTYTSFQHTDPVARDTRIQIFDFATNLVHVLNVNPVLPAAFPVLMARQVLVPHGYRLQGEVIGLAVGQTARISSMRRILTFGRKIPPLA